MKIRVFKNSGIDLLPVGLPVFLLTLPIAAIIAFGLWHLESSSRSDGRRLLEDSVKNTVVRHYVIEGSYPSGISVIEEKYGIYIDRNRYSVIYEVFAPNIMPDITVLELTHKTHGGSKR